jgi:ABC-type polysaccharide/polyol phosphate export permease
MIKVKRALAFFVFIFKQRFIIQQLVKRDFQNKYLASYLGLIWAFAQPAVLIIVMWFAFTFGFKIKTTDSGMPFVPWLICGMLPWLFISDTLINTANSLIEYSYLIKKNAFNVGTIPLIKIITAFIIHLFFLAVIIIIAIAYGYYPTIYWIQIPYYLFATFILLTGIGWCVSALTVFVRDIGYLITVATSVLFWATPIIWPYSMLQGHYKYVALLNPFFYITEGYRYTFLQQKWFFNNIEMNFSFWLITLFFVVSGGLIFQRLKPHFADVL